MSSKLKRVREQMAQKGATLHLMSSLYDIAWLLNVRGGDISYVPRSAFIPGTVTGQLHMVFAGRGCDRNS